MRNDEDIEKRGREELSAGEARIAGYANPSNSAVAQQFANYCTSKSEKSPSVNWELFQAILSKIQNGFPYALAVRAWEIGG